MSWYLAKSLQTLRRQANTLAPNRSKASDGTLGDARHSASVSDHNPTSTGQVCALDLTHDPSGGLDAHGLADFLLKQQDPRLRYVISRGRIGSGPAGPSPGVWRRYDGSNPHDKHAHISVRAGALGDQTHPWQLHTAAPAVPQEEPVLQLGAAGPAVAYFQECLRAEGKKNKRAAASLAVDGKYQRATQLAVDAFQRAWGLRPTGDIDGVTGAVLTRHAPEWA